MTVIYEEKAPISNAIRAALIGVALLLGIATVLSFLGVYEAEARAPYNATKLLAVLTGVVGFLSWSFFNMRFRLTGKGVEGRMYPFIFMVPYNDITDVRVLDKIPWYVGWGLRIWGRRLAFVSMHKPATAIGKKTGFFRTLVLTTRDPERFAEMIRNRKR